MSGELKPCPFCGGEAEVVRKSTRVMVICPSAGPVCMTLRSESYGNDDAITAWNTRAPTACTPDHIEVANAIKATEYKYFGDYEMSDDQRHAVDVLVRFAQTYVTPSQGLDAATVERCAQVAESLASAEDEALQHAKNEAPADRARIAVIAAEFRRAAKVIRGLAKEKPDA